MHITKAKEDLSISYISTLCASSGIAYEIHRHDDDSTDGELKKRINLGNGCLFDAQLRVQLKCTSSYSQYTDKGEYITYKLNAKNYNDLCTPSTTTIILGLLVLPEDEKEWVKWSEQELLLKGCMYWANFSGNPISKNLSTVSVDLSKKHVINGETLQELLEKIAKEEWP